MTKWLFDKLSSLDGTLAAVLIIILITLFGWGIKFVFKHRNDIKELIEKWFENKSKKNELINIVHSNQQRINEFYESRIHDREQSFAVQKQLTDAINVIKDKLDEMEQKNNKRIRNEMKNRISDSYRYYHAHLKWNDMEKEAFMGLIEEYESAGGTNSFVHDTVLPEAHTWEVIDRI